MHRIAVLAVMVGVMMGCSQQAFGQATRQPVELEAVVVTATRTAVPLKDTASSVTVIDAEQIEARQLRTVAAALREVPGVDIVQTGGHGGTTSAFLRGTNSNHTLVLIDGVPVNSATTGAVDFANLTTENIERIEVIRGPQSTLYGSEAIGGVIQIITKRGQGPAKVSGSAETGAYGTFRETLELRGAAGLADYSVSGGRLDTTGFSKANHKAGNPEQDGYNNTTWSSRLGVALAQDTRLEWTATQTNARTEIDGLAPPLFTFADTKQVMWTSSLATALKLTAPVTHVWDHQLTLSANEENVNGTDPDNSFNNFRFATQGRRLDWQHNVSLRQRDRLTVGYEYEALGGVNQGNFDQALFTNAGYLLGQHVFAPFRLNLGMRFDNSSQFGNETTYKAEAAYHAPTGGKFRTAYGTGFRSPTLNDLFFPGFSNPVLKPERSRSVEAGLDQPFWNESVRIGLTYFQTEIENLIVSASPTFRPENVQKSRISGIEFALEVMPVPVVAFSAQYTNTEAKNLDTDKELARRPRHKASGTMTITPSNDLRLNIDVRHFGQRFDNITNAVSMVDYTVVNLAGTYALTKQIELFTRAENLFNQDYEEVKGYGTSGLAVFGGVKATL